MTMGESAAGPPSPRRQGALERLTLDFPLDPHPLAHDGIDMLLDTSEHVLRRFTCEPDVFRQWGWGLDEREGRLRLGVDGELQRGGAGQGARGGR